MHLGELIKQYRSDHGMSQAEFAQKSGISKGYISMLENNKNPDSGKPLAPTYTVFSKVANTIGCTTDSLMRMMDEGQMITVNSDMSGEKLPSNIIPMPKTRKVPLVGTIACGEPILAEENLEGEVDTPEYIHADFALRCKGDSMINARIYDGDIVYIRQQPTVDDGEIAAVLIDDEATLKRVRFFEDHVVLEPENPLYRPLAYWGEEMTIVHILGKAVAFTSKVR